MAIECTHPLLRYRYQRPVKYGQRLMDPLLGLWLHRLDFRVYRISFFIELVAAKSVDLINHCIWIWDNIPSTPNNFFSFVKRHKSKYALLVSTGPKRNGALWSRVLTIARRILRMHLTLFSNLETKVFLVVEDLIGHDGFGSQSVRYSALCW